MSSYPNNLIPIEHFNKVVQEAADFVSLVDKQDKQKEFQSLERAQRQFQESERNLRRLNNRLQTVINRQNENFQKRIDSLKNQNTKTHEIKLKMDKEFKDQHEKHFWDYIMKQEAFMKRMKKQEKKNREQLKKKHFKSVDMHNQVENNKRIEEHKLSEFRERIRTKHRV